MEDEVKGTTQSGDSPCPWNHLPPLSGTTGFHYLILTILR